MRCSQRVPEGAYRPVERSPDGRPVLLPGAVPPVLEGRGLALEGESHEETTDERAARGPLGHQRSHEQSGDAEHEREGLRVTPPTQHHVGVERVGLLPAQSRTGTEKHARYGPDEGDDHHLPRGELAVRIARLEKGLRVLGRVFERLVVLVQQRIGIGIQKHSEQIHTNSQNEVDKLGTSIDEEGQEGSK